MLGAAQKSPQAFRTISEVAEELELPQHVLRFWETKFAAVRPLKRGGGRRYYRPDDVDLLRGIRSLLHNDGLTIKGVQKVLRERGPRYVAQVGRGAVSHIRALNGLPPREDDPASNVRLFPRDPVSPLLPSDDERARFESLLGELLELKSRLQAARRRKTLS